MRDSKHRIAFGCVLLVTLLVVAHMVGAVHADDAPPTGLRIVTEDQVGKIPKGTIPSTLRISPDGKRIAGVIARGDKQVVFINSEESPEYDGVVQDSIHFSPDSKRVAYAAKVGNRAFVMIDGIEYPAFDACAIGFPIFGATGEHFLYVAGREGKMCVVADGKEGPNYEALSKGGPMFGPDGKRFVYVAKVGERSRAVIDGIAGQAYRIVDSPTFSLDGKHIAYAMTQTTSSLVVDGQEVATAENFLRDSLGFDSSTRIHILVLDREGGISRFQVDLMGPSPEEKPR